MPLAMSRKVEDILIETRSSGERVAAIVAQFAEVEPVLDTDGKFTGEYRRKGSS
jgi:hypothetical protein